MKKALDVFRDIADQDLVQNPTVGPGPSPRRKLEDFLSDQDNSMKIEAPKPAQDKDRRRILDMVIEDDTQLRPKDCGFDQQAATAFNKPNLPKLQDLFVQEENETVLHFYLLDVQEHNYRLYLSGVVLSAKRVCTVNIQVENMCKYLYFPLKDGADQRKAETEIKKTLVQKCGIGGTFTGKFVDRIYEFEIKGIKRGKGRYYKVTYFMDDPKNKKHSYRADWAGQTFHCIIGTQYKASQLFIVKRRIKGPSWLSILKSSITLAKVSFGQGGLSLIVNNFKAIAPSVAKLQEPKLRVLSFSAKYVRPKDIKSHAVLGGIKTDNQPVILCLAGAVHQSYNTDVNVRQGALKMKSFALNATKAVLNPKSKCAHNKYATEEEMLNNFLAFVVEQDPDFVVCHDIYSNSLDLLITRCVKKNIRNISGLSRLAFGLDLKTENAARKKENATKGRLLIDTFVFAKDQMRLRDYSLYQLSGMLSERLQAIQPDELKRLLEDKDVGRSLDRLVDHTVLEAKLSFELMCHLEVVQLTKQLTNICGNLWRRSLQNQRAQRNQFLIMHKIYPKKYIIPDKFSKREAEEDEPAKKKKYEGGLVLQPKKGLYHDYVILLDFNSLYPSIIRQYNICFSKVQRRLLPLAHYLKPEKKEQDADPELVDDGFKAEPPPEDKRGEKDWGFLPRILHEIVLKRKEKKKEMEETTDRHKKLILDITQKAYKLVANSIYGCLGFSSSRFYAEDLAALITRKGRQTLQFAESVAKDVDGLQVIYGDTDSIMLRVKNSMGERLVNVLKPIQGLLQNINKVFKKLEIAVDGVFKPMLLLKKKKYAALKLANLQGHRARGEPEQWVSEYKGIDMVRRDWSQVSRQASERVLNIILREQNIDQVRNRIVDYMRELAEKMTDTSQLGKYLISKMLTKHPKDYARGGKGDGLPHVTVALRRLQRGEPANLLINHMIYYVICKGEGSLGQRAHDYQEYKDSMRTAKPLEIDLTYYKKEQVMPPLERLVGEIQELDPFLFARELGLSQEDYSPKHSLASKEPQQNNSISLTHFQDFNEAHAAVCTTDGCPNQGASQPVFSVKGSRVLLNHQCQCSVSLLECIANQLSIYLFTSMRDYYSQQIKCKSSSCDNYWPFSLGLECTKCGKKGLLAVQLSKVSSFLYELLRVLERERAGFKEGKMKREERLVRAMQEKIQLVLQENADYEMVSCKSLLQVLKL